MLKSRQLQPDILTIKEVAGMLRTSPETIRRRCRQRRMPHFRLFGQIRFRRAEIDAWIDELCECSESAKRSVFAGCSRHSD